MVTSLRRGFDLTKPARYIFTSRQSNVVPSSLDGVEIAFVGESVDDRGSATTDALKNVAKTVLSLRFDANNQGTYLNGEETSRERLAHHLRDKTRILMDATTLGLGELLQILLAAGRAETMAIEFLYAEPKQYIRRTAESAIDGQLREFSLTNNCSFCSVQGFAHEYQPHMRAAHVFLLGFEPARILNAIEQRNDFDREHYRCHVVIGVPAFQAGWESNAIRPHLSVLEDLDIGENSITYCQANSIRETYLTLWDLYQQLGDERGCFYVSPLGTKPHAVGTALFLLETKGNDIPTSLYYDHPVRVPNRSSEVATWHHVQVQLRDG